MQPASINVLIRALTAAALPALLAGCTAYKQQRATILYQEGCVLYLQGITSEQAATMTRDWDFSSGCEVKIVTASGVIGTETSK